MAEEENTEQVTEETSEATETETATEAQPEPEAAAQTEEPKQEEVSEERPSSDELADNLVNQLPTVEGEEEPRKEVEGGRAYEVIYIVRNGDTDAVEQSIERVKAIIEGEDGAVDNVRASEPRRLAYPIQKETEGTYVVANARFAPKVSTELERYFRIDETILRAMVLREED